VEPSAMHSLPPSSRNQVDLTMEGFKHSTSFTLCKFVRPAERGLLHRRWRRYTSRFLDTMAPPDDLELR